MHINKVTGLLVLLCCDLCWTIKVPTVWQDSDNSAVNNQAQVEVIQPQKVQTLQSKSIPIEYFQYTAQKPQFAVDIAAFHGVNNPQNHYKAYPIKPFTGQIKPVIGLHQKFNQDTNVHEPFQSYVQKNKEIKNNAKPISTGYEIFHPYKAEEPALQAIYRDPTLTKIRTDLHDSKNRLKAYEEDIGRANISSDEYLENHQKTEEKLFPQSNIPARYEIHRPERRPIYYKVPSRETPRDHVLNQRFKHPWNQHNIKIRPVHYKPLKKHIHNLRQQHGTKYDDERNEYPQVIVAENTAEPQEGIDIYERGKQKYTQLRNNVDYSINQAALQNRPATYEKLELQKEEPESKDEDEEFIPIKNYAQVRKTETFKHVPKKAAFDDAETYEEIINAPRLREAVKSTRAQTVYSEEGYEDSAYDHAGEQKHASDHEGHGGLLKQKESSNGLYKIPSVLGSYQDGRGLEYRDNIEHGKKWRKKDEEDEDESRAEDYSENEREKSIQADFHDKRNLQGISRNKREKESLTENNGSSNFNNSTHKETVHDNIFTKAGTSAVNDSSLHHDVDKREVDFQVPEINFDSTFLTEQEILKIANSKLMPMKDNIKVKYPYYFKKLKNISKNSPLIYSENLKFIPKKSEGGTEFYDSRSKFECPEVDDDVDPVPQKLKDGENPTEEDSEEQELSNSNNQNEFDVVKKQPRLSGLGDKIDCFKAKYFGENPLDSPFFKEETISSPEPIWAPKLPIYKRLKIKNNISDANNQTSLYALLTKLRTDSNKLQKSLNKNSSDLKAAVIIPLSNTNENAQQIINKTHAAINLEKGPQNLLQNMNEPVTPLSSDNNYTTVIYRHFNNKEEVTKLPPLLRKKRSTVPFIYEPYKIIKDVQFQDSKKTTTTGNISPLIKQLQSSRVADRVSRSNHDQRQIRPGVNNRSYVDIGRKERNTSSSIPTIVDVSVDQRRGEPRYEIRPSNHKAEYTPVENKKTISLHDYKTHGTANKRDDANINEEVINKQARNGQRIKKPTTVRPFYDVSPFLPSVPDRSQNTAESNAVKKISSSLQKEKKLNKNVSDEDHEDSEEDYDDDEEEEELTTSTSTTIKPSFKRRIRPTTTTNKPQHANDDEPEKLRLITRFRNYKPPDKSEEIKEVTEPSTETKYKEDVSMPKYREKKKKSSQSTLVTDTKTYGSEDGGEDDMKKEVDALIGVKQDMNEYIPLYEKEEQQKQQKSQRDEDDSSEEDEDNDDDESYDDDDDDEEEDEIGSDESIDDDEDDEYEEESPVSTTPEPTKRTLVKTTDAPIPTKASYVQNTASRGASRHEQNINKPIITRKKIEIHNESPVNKTSPHVTQFKQDIKEVEIIKESPIVLKRKPHKKGPVLELYKDDNLAKDINKLGDVEIFNENVELDERPKHGGNYRKATKEDLKQFEPQRKHNLKPLKDTEASQSKTTKQIEFDGNTPQRMHGGNLKSVSNAKRTSSSGRSGKLVELSDRPTRTMHGGNFKRDNKKQNEKKSEKLIEFDDDHDDDHSTNDDSYKSSPHHTRTDRLHGGNYRSEKLVVEKENDDIKVRNPDRDARRSSALLLNSFVQAAPVLTTTPSYILDPSKRMYYYVDA